MKIKPLSAIAIALLLTIAVSIACNQTESKVGNIRSLSPDPCAEAEATANKATTLSQTGFYSTAKDKIRAAFAEDGLEHAISFGKDAAGNNINSAMSTGNGHSSHIEAGTNIFADIHNHPKGTPPSSGDLYGFIGMAADNSHYETRYIITAGDVVYALVIVNLKAAKDFVTKYPKVSNPGYQPGFPDSLVDEINQMKAVYAATDEMATAFILDKYNTGVALLKQESDGNFKRLVTVEATDPTGSKKYVAENCQ